jgi:hypothetical protein
MQDERITVLQSKLVTGEVACCLEDAFRGRARGHGKHDLVDEFWRSAANWSQFHFPAVFVEVEVPVFD